MSRPGPGRERLPTRIGRDGFVALLTGAIAERRPFATGKLGVTERSFLHHPLLLETEPSPVRRRAFEISLMARALRQAGLFPADASFLRRFSARFAEAVGELDCIGLFEFSEEELGLIWDHRFNGELVHFLDQEPDRGSPADDSRCWLPALHARRVLIVSPFAELLRDRAERSTYEAAWEKIGKRWFEPAEVDAVSFPYGFDPETERRYGDALNLLDAITGEIERHEFDVALIGAGALAIPIAARIKKMGKVGVSMGGHLQIVFGVHGERWLSQPEWVHMYFNDAWVRVPEDQRPDPSLTGEDYW